jgi:hypothetical protein
MRTARSVTPVVTPRRRARVLRLLPAAALFAGLVLGGPSPAAAMGIRPMVPDNGGHQCTGQVNEKGDCIITGTNTGYR